jgi:hypothetical protein
MLNALWDLAHSLREADISPDSRPQDFQTCPKTPGLRVSLDARGRVTDLTVLPKETMPTLRHWAPSNQAAFPSGNVPPFCVGPKDKDESGRWAKDLRTPSRDEMNHLLAEAEKTGFRNPEKPRQSGGKSEEEEEETEMGPAPRPDLAAHFAPFQRGLDSFSAATDSMASEPTVALVRELGRRFEAALAGGKLYEDLKRAFLALWERDREQALFAFPLFAGKGKDDKVQVLFDADVPAGEESPYAGKNQERLGKALLGDGTSSGDGAEGGDAFGLNASGSSDLMGKANLGILGPRILYNLNRDTPCLERYGRIGSRGFPIGSEARQRIKDAVEWLTDRDRRGQTWEDVSKFCGYDGGILCAYAEAPSEGFLRDLPVVGVYAGGFSTEDADGEGKEPPSVPARGEIWEIARTGPVIRALRARVDKCPAVRVRTFVLVNADPGRSRILDERTLPGEAYIRAAERWQAGARNIPELPGPPLSLRKGFRTKAGGGAPFPAEVSCFLDQRWIRDGRGWSMGSRSPFSDGFDLFCGHPDLRRMMRLAVESGSTLLLAWSQIVQKTVGTAEEENKGKKRKATDTFLYETTDKPQKTNKTGFSRAEWLVKFPALLGILLAADGRRKDEYMKSAPYLIGQLLSAADRLHERYCRREDEKAILPPKLLGNCLVVAAGRNPPNRAVQNNCIHAEVS